MGLPQNETNLLSLLRSPAKRSIFSVHKVKWHFPSRCPWRRVKYLQRCRPTPVSQVCVEQGRRPPKKRKQTPRRPNLEPPPTRRFTEETAASGEKKEREKPVRARAKEILDLKHGCFVFTWTRRLLQTDGEWKYLIMRGRFPSYFGFAGDTKRSAGFLRSF